MNEYSPFIAITGMGVILICWGNPVDQPFCC
jgi:hypothetical protein